MIANFTLDFCGVAILILEIIFLRQLCLYKQMVNYSGFFFLRMNTRLFKPKKYYFLNGLNIFVFLIYTQLLRLILDKSFLQNRSLIYEKFYLRSLPLIRIC